MPAQHNLSVAEAIPFSYVPQSARIQGVVEDLDVVDPELPSVQATATLIEKKKAEYNTLKYGADKKTCFPDIGYWTNVIEYMLAVERDPKHTGDANETSAWRTKYRLQPNGNTCTIWTKTKNRYIVTKEQTHKVLAWAHTACGHGGRDETYKMLTTRYHSDKLTKEFILEWIGHCPSCRGGKGKKKAKRPRPMRIAQRDIMTAADIDNMLPDVGLGQFSAEYEPAEAASQPIGLQQQQFEDFSLEPENMAPALEIDPTLTGLDTPPTFEEFYQAIFEMERGDSGYETKSPNQTALNKGSNDSFDDWINWDP